MSRLSTKIYKLTRIITASTRVPFTAEMLGPYVDDNETKYIVITIKTINDWLEALN